MFRRFTLILLPALSLACGGGDCTDTGTCRAATQTTKAPDARVQDGGDSGADAALDAGVPQGGGADSGANALLPEAGDSENDTDLNAAKPDDAGREADASDGENPVIPALGFVPTTAPLAYEDASYEMQLDLVDTSGGPHEWALLSGELPDGIALHATDIGAELSGVPLELGSFDLTVRVIDSFEQVATLPLTIEVTPAPWLIHIQYAENVVNGVDLNAMRWLWNEPGAPRKLNQGYLPVQIGVGSESYAWHDQALWFEAAPAGGGSEDLVSVPLDLVEGPGVAKVVSTGTSLSLPGYLPSPTEPNLFAFAEGNNIRLADSTGNRFPLPAAVGGLSSTDFVLHSTSGQFVMLSGREGAANAVELVRINANSVSAPVPLSLPDPANDVVMSTFFANSTLAGVWLLNPTTGSSRLRATSLVNFPTIAEEDLDTNIRLFDLSPNERWLIYVRGVQGGSQLWAIDLLSEDYAKTRISDTVAGISGGFRWGEDVGDLYFAAAPAFSQTFQVFRSHLGPNGPEQAVQLTNEPLSTSGIALDGWIASRNLLLYQRWNGSLELGVFALDVSPGSTEPPVQLTPDLAEGETAGMRNVSPDGKRLAIWTKSESDAEARLHLVDLTDLDSVNRTQLGPFYHRASVRWSPDSQNIIYDIGVGLERQQYVLRVSPGHLGEPVALGAGTTASWLD